MRGLCVCILGFFSSSVWASPKHNLREQTLAASSIVLGQVVETQSYYGSDGEIQSDVTIRVSAALKSLARTAGDLRTFTVMGGTVGDTRVTFSDVPRFTVDEAVMVFFVGDHAQEKYTVRDGWVAELHLSAGEALRTIEGVLAEAGLPVIEDEGRRAKAFVKEPASTARGASADAACYVLYGATWKESVATYRLNATIPASWQPAIADAAGAWTSAGTSFRFRLDEASINELSVGAVPSGGVATTRLEEDINRGIRRMTIVFSSAFAAALTVTDEPNKYDVQSVATHEFGHGVGLHHPTDPSCQEQTMWATLFPGETKKRTLEAGDKSGISQIYAVTAPVPTPTPTPAPPPPTPPPAAPPPATAPAPVVTLTAILPAVPKANQSFTILVMGTGFAAGLSQVVVTGPSCPSGCVVTPSLTTWWLTASVRLAGAGTYSAGVRNGPGGAMSAVKNFSVAP